MKRIPWKSLVPVFAALALFYILSLAYFSPMLEGKRLIMGDIRNYQGMAQEVEEHRERTGEEALWTGSMFSGMPAYQISVKWSANLLQQVNKVFTGFLPRPASFLFLYLLGMFVLLRVLKIDPWLSMVGAIAYGFSSYFFIILDAGHTSKASAIGYMPLVLAGVWLLYRGRMLLGAALLALFLGLQITVNHVQVTYYLGMLLVLFVLAEGIRAVREKHLADFLKRSGLGVVALAFALLCNIGLLWSTWEYGKFTTRGESELTIQADGSSAEDIRTSGLDRDYVTDWSYGLQESFTLLVPDAKGGATGMIGNDPDALAGSDPRFRQNVSQMNRYWGDQRFTSGPVYLGALVVLLMLLMLAQAEGAARWWTLGALPLLMLLVNVPSPVVAFVLIAAYLAAGLVLWKDTLAVALFGSFILTLVLSWGRNYMPLTDFFLDHIPGYSKFRAVTIILVIVELAAPILGVLYLDRLLKQKGWDKGTEKRSLIAMGGLLMVLLLMALVPGSLFDFVSEQERDAFSAQIADAPAQEAQYMQFVDSIKQVRINIFTADVWRSFAFVLAGGILIFLFGRRKVGPAVLVAGMGVLILADLWIVDKRYLHNEKVQGRYEKWEDAQASAMPHKANAADKAILEEAWNPAAEADYQVQLAELKKRKQNESARHRQITPDEDLLLRFGSLRRNADHRVLTLSNPFNDSRVSWFHRSAGGYHGAKLKRYQELIEFQISPALDRVSNQLRTGTSMPQLDSMLAREGVLNMLNIRYLMYDPDRPPINNLNANGAAWFVDDIRWVPNADAEIQALGETDLSRTAVVDERFRSALAGVAPKADASASAELTKYETNALSYTVRSADGGLVLFSEIWYGPDWQASIDGKPVDHIRANYVLRALEVPGGEHTVEFHIRSRAFDTSQPIALASSALVILLVLGVLFMELRATRARDDEPHLKLPK